MIRRSAVLVVLVSLFAVVNTLHGMGVADSQGGEKFKCNTPRFGTPELERVSLSELIHQHVRAAIETAVYEELQAALGTSPYERRDVRRGYRNGVRERTLTGPTGPVALTLPRAILFSGAGAAKPARGGR